MIWALLFSIIFGAGESVFILPKMEKYVKRHLDNKEYVQEFKEIRKTSKKVRKDFNKANKKKIKQLNKLNASWEAKREDFYVIGKAAMEKREEMQKSELAGLVNVKNFISEEQWDLIIEDTQKDLKKYYKQNDKKLRKLKKSLEKVENTIRRKLPENKQNKFFYDELEEYNNTLVSKVSLYYDYAQSDTNIMLKYKVSEEDYISLINEANNYRTIIFNEYVDLHFALVKVTSKQEFNAIIRQLNKIF